MSSPIAAKPNRSATRAGCARRIAAVVPEEMVTGSGVKPAVGVAIASSWASNSSALWGRSAGCFARHRMIRFASAGGTLSRCWVTGSGVAVTWAASMPWGDKPPNGDRPVSSS